MKILICKSVMLLLVLVVGSEIQQKKITVMVLPPYDEISNAGISPNIRKMLENTLQEEKLATMKFPFKKLMNVSYQNVFDKKYCKPILEKVKADRIVMSKIDQVARSGHPDDDNWNLAIRIYNPKTNKQINSSLVCKNCDSDSIPKFLNQNKQKLIEEIRNTR